MKQVQLNTVSDKMVHYIRTMKENDEWNMAKAAVADAYNVVVDAMADNSKSFEDSQKFVSILIILNSYNEHLDLFHEEANRE